MCESETLNPMAGVSLVDLFKGIQTYLPHNLTWKPIEVHVRVAWARVESVRHPIAQEQINLSQTPAA